MLRQFRLRHRHLIMSSNMAAAIILSALFLSDEAAATSSASKSSKSPPPQAKYSTVVQIKGGAPTPLPTPPSPAPPTGRPPVPPSPPAGYLASLPRDIEVWADPATGTLMTLPSKKSFRLHVSVSYTGLHAAGLVGPLTLTHPIACLLYTSHYTRIKPYIQPWHTSLAYILGILRVHTQTSATCPRLNLPFIASTQVPAFLNDTMSALSLAFWVPDDGRCISNLSISGANWPVAAPVPAAGRSVGSCLHIMAVMYLLSCSEGEKGCDDSTHASWGGYMGDQGCKRQQTFPHHALILTWRVDGICRVVLTIDH